MKIPVESQTMTVRDLYKIRKKKTMQLLKNTIIKDRRENECDVAGGS